MNVYSEQIYVSRGEIKNSCGYYSGSRMSRRRVTDLKPSLGCQSCEGESSRIVVKYGELSTPSRDRRMHPEEGPEVPSKEKQGALSATSYTEDKKKSPRLCQ